MYMCARANPGRKLLLMAKIFKFFARRKRFHARAKIFKYRGRWISSKIEKKKEKGVMILDLHVLRRSRSRSCSAFSLVHLVE